MPPLQKSRILHGERYDRSDCGPRREREDRPERNDGPEPEFAPAFLTRDDD